MTDAGQYEIKSRFELVSAALKGSIPVEDAVKKIGTMTTLYGAGNVNDDLALKAAIEAKHAGTIGAYAQII